MAKTIQNTDEDTILSYSMARPVRYFIVYMPKCSVVLHSNMRNFVCVGSVETQTPFDTHRSRRNVNKMITFLKGIALK